MRLSLSRLPNLRNIRRSREWQYLCRFVFTCGSIIFINDNVLETTHITGASMAPTLSPRYHETGQEDLVLWKKWNPTRDLQRGDVVHFSNPARPEGLAVKRIIALEGDIVLLNKRRRPRRGEGPEIPEARSWDAWKGRAKIPPGHIWVEGDNTGHSTDSNDYGPISKSLIVGKAPCILWPSSRFGILPRNGYRSRTKVIEANEDQGEKQILPIELAEAQDPHLRR